MRRDLALLGPLPTMTPAGPLPTMTPAAIGRVQMFEQVELSKPQKELGTDHLIHAGIYSRTILLKAGLQITGALVKIPTTVIIDGDCLVWLGTARVKHVVGRGVLAAGANRKQSFEAILDTWITMQFATKARTVEECERQFTDQWRELASARDSNTNTVTVTED